MQTQVMCKVIGTKKTQKGLMFQATENFTFEDLILWVYHNCPGDRVITIDNDEIYVKYEERVEIYHLEKK